MAVESSANNISQLNPNWPLESDFIPEGPAHFQVIKRVLKQTFHKIKEIVNITDNQMNTLASAVKDVLTTDRIELYEGTVITKAGNMTLGNEKVSLPELTKATVLTYASAFDVFYPIGSLFHTTSTADPSEVFGIGTWERYSQGRYLVGVGEDLDAGTNIPSVGKLGNKSVTLKTDNLPAHNHAIDISTVSAGVHSHTAKNVVHHYSVSSTDYVEGATLEVPSEAGRWGSDRYPKTSSEGAHQHEIKGNTEDTGKGTPFDIMPPSQSVYIWRRTA